MNKDYDLIARKASTSVIADQVFDAIQSDDSLGFCLDCGAMAYGVEPNARHYECESCGERWVFGAQETLLYLPED